MKPTVRAALRFALGAVLAVLAAELVVRQTFFKPWTSDPDFGYVLRPGSTVRFAGEGSGTSRWTAHGVRRSALPDAESAPILAVGDSFTEALMIDDADVYSHRLEALLAADTPAIPVLNVGRSGASVADYIALAPKYRELFAPRWAVIQLRDNDLGEEAWAQGAAGRLQRTDDGKLASSFRAEQARFFGAAVAAVSPWLTLPNYAVVRLREFQEAARKEAPLFFGAQAAKPRAKDPDPEASFPVEESLDALADAYQGRMTILWLPDFDPDAPDGPPTHTEQRAMARCREKGWSCVDLRDAFPDFAEHHESPYGFANSVWNKGHLNALGHRTAGEMLHDEIGRLRARGLL